MTMTEKDGILETADVILAHGVTFGYLSHKSEDIPEWDEIARVSNPDKIIVFIADKDVELPPKCGAGLTALFETLRLEHIAIEFEHSEPIELH